eukprot:1969480-Pleurochrysis_carterae.AAC.3
MADILSTEIPGDPLSVFRAPYKCTQLVIPMLPQILSEALKSVGYVEDRGASCTDDCQGLFKYQHDTDKDLKESESTCAHCSRTHCTRALQHALTTTSSSPSPPSSKHVRLRARTGARVQSHVWELRGTRAAPCCTPLGMMTLALTVRAVMQAPAQTRVDANKRDRGVCVRAHEVICALDHRELSSVYARSRRS